MNIEELMQDESFIEEIKNVTSAEELTELLCSKGIDVTVDQIKAAMAEADGELDENALDSIAGGSLSSAWDTLVRWVKNPVREAERLKNDAQQAVRSALKRR